MTASRSYTAHRAGQFVECREWDKDELRSLRRHWTAGMSIREIGRKLGRSENSVVGCVHRLKLKPRPSPIIRSAAPSPQPRAAATPSAHAGQIRAGGSGAVVSLDHNLPPVVPLPDDASSRSAAFSQCQYPYGERGDWQWCGKPVAILGEPYCKECRARCYAVPPRFRWAA